MGIRKCTTSLYLLNVYNSEGLADHSVFEPQDIPVCTFFKQAFELAREKVMLIWNMQ